MYDVSISMIIRITRGFNANMKHEEIYQNILNKKMIWYMVIEERISGFIWQKFWGFTSSNIQKHIWNAINSYKKIKSEKIWRSLEI